MTNAVLAMAAHLQTLLACTRVFPAKLESIRTQVVPLVAKTVMQESFRIHPVN